MRSADTETIRELISVEIDALPAPPADLFVRTLAMYRAEVHLRPAGGRPVQFSVGMRTALAVAFAFLPPLAAGQVAASLGLSEPLTVHDIWPKPRLLAQVARLFGLA